MVGDLRLNRYYATTPVRSDYRWKWKTDELSRAFGRHRQAAVAAIPSHGTKTIDFCEAL
jgi:hypothetical protein